MGTSSEFDSDPSLSLFGSEAIQKATTLLYVLRELSVLPNERERNNRLVFLPPININDLKVAMSELRNYIGEEERLWIYKGRNEEYGIEYYPKIDQPQKFQRYRFSNLRELTAVSCATDMSGFFEMILVEHPSSAILGD